MRTHLTRSATLPNGDLPVKPVDAAGQTARPHAT